MAIAVGLLHTMDEVQTFPIHILTGTFEDLLERRFGGLGRKRMQYSSH
jgi:hypothetical protein